MFLCPVTEVKVWSRYSCVPCGKLKGKAAATVFITYLILVFKTDTKNLCAANSPVPSTRKKPRGNLCARSFCFFCFRENKLVKQVDQPRCSDFTNNTNVRKIHHVWMREVKPTSAEFHQFYEMITETSAPEGKERLCCRDRGESLRPRPLKT